MVKETVHIVQPHWEDKRKGLVPAEALGEYGEPVFHARLGQVPDHEGG